MANCSLLHTPLLWRMSSSTYNTTSYLTDKNWVISYKNVNTNYDSTPKPRANPQSLPLPTVSQWCQTSLYSECNSSEPAAVGGSGFQFLPLKKSGVDWNRYENHPISQLKNYAYLDENMPYPIQPISHYAAAYKLTIHKFYLAVAQDRHKPPDESGHVSLFTRSYACAAL